MSFHDKAAEIAKQAGGTADQYRRSARKHGAQAVLLLLVAVLAGNTLQWVLGVLISIPAAYKAMQAYSCAAIATRLARDVESGESGD